MSTLTMTDIEALFEGHRQAWNNADPNGLAAAYAPEGRLFTPFGEECDGQDAVRKTFEAYFGGLLAGTTTEISVDDVRPLGGDLFIVDATQTISGPLPPLHVTAVVRQRSDQAELVELRPFAWLPKP